MKNMQALLLWYRDMGMDYPISHQPVNQFDLSEKHKAQSQKKPAQKVAVINKQVAKKPPPESSPTVPDEQAIKKATELANAANSLEQLQKTLENFEGCNLKLTASKTVFADGNPKSPLMIIGEAPGREEDEQGLPFVGRAGQLLDKMLAAISRDRTNSYITNIIAWRPPGNRTPTVMETSICRPFVERHIDLVRPKIILLMGGSAAKTMLKTDAGILTLRGKWQNLVINGTTYRALPTLHPAFLLRQPLQKRLSWGDFLLLQEALAGK